MDPNEMMKTEGFDGTWTDEKHTSFLNWMEASFVRRMLFRNGDDDECPRTKASMGTWYPPKPPAQQRLDRYVPDSAESTLDSRNPGGRRRTMKRSDHPDISGLGIQSGGRTRKRSTRRYNVPQDQVVPLCGSTNADENQTRGELAVLPTSHH